MAPAVQRGPKTTTASTASKVACTDLPGAEWSQITATSTNVDMLKHQSGGITTDWVTSDTILVTTGYEAGTDLSGITDLSLGGNQVNGWDSGRRRTAPTTTPGTVGVLQVEFVVATGATQFQGQRSFRASLGTVRWGRCAVYNLTPLSEGRSPSFS